jgi:hypothetical protein
MIVCQGSLFTVAAAYAATGRESAGEHDELAPCGAQVALRRDQSPMAQRELLGTRRGATCESSHYDVWRPERDSNSGPGCWQSFGIGRHLGRRNWRAKLAKRRGAQALDAIRVPGPSE